LGSREERPPKLGSNAAGTLRLNAKRPPGLGKPRGRPPREQAQPGKKGNREKPNEKPVNQAEDRDLGNPYPKPGP